MVVRDLIELLKQQNPDAVVVMWDRFDGEPQISKLGYGEVNAIDLCGHEANGLFVLEVYDEQRKDNGPFPGVVLGSRD